MYIDYWSINNFVELRDIIITFSVGKEISMEEVSMEDLNQQTTTRFEPAILYLCGDKITGFLSAEKTKWTAILFMPKHDEAGRKEKGRQDRQEADLSSSMIQGLTSVDPTVCI